MSEQQSASEDALRRPRPTPGKGGIACASRPCSIQVSNPQCEGGAREPRVLRIAATWQAASLHRGAAGRRQLGCGRVRLRLQIQIGYEPC